MTDLDRAVKDALVLGLENDPTAENILRIATPFIERAFQDQKGRIEKLEAALRNIAEGDTPRTVKISFRDDGQSSKHDRCEHGQWMYEDCGCCIEDYARKELK